MAEIEKLRQVQIEDIKRRGMEKKIYIEELRHSNKA
jgi:hypothetical protein